jgi:hypothetical protein
MWVADTLGFDVDFPKESGKELAWHTVLVEMVSHISYSNNLFANFPFECST